MHGNCLTFAIPDFIKYGGKFYIEFWGKSHWPHFTVQRKNKVYDFSSSPMSSGKEFWFDGKTRCYDVLIYGKFPQCKRVLLMSKKIRIFNWWKVGYLW